MLRFGIILANKNISLVKIKINGKIYFLDIVFIKIKKKKQNSAGA